MGNSPGLPLASIESPNDVEQRGQVLASAWLAAIVENSDDAILSKTLDGIITSWNGAAERLFGFTAQEAIGQSITIIIPDDRLSEETTIIGRIRSGLRVEHFETVRRRKDGSLFDVSVTVSPVRDDSGAILGASKILRDITERKKADERQNLLLREMDHRIKNLFTLTSGLITVSARGAPSGEELAATLCHRIASLARAHRLTLVGPDQEIEGDRSTTLSALLHAILEPYEGRGRIDQHGNDVPVGTNALTSVALLLHELATNSAKYGALSSENGLLTVQITSLGDHVELVWSETGGPAPEPRAAVEGFGTRLERASLQTLGGSAERRWRADGLDILLDMSVQRMAG